MGKRHRRGEKASGEQKLGEIMIKKLILLTTWCIILAGFTGTGILFAMESREDGSTTIPPVLRKEDTAGIQQETPPTKITIVCSDEEIEIDSNAAKKFKQLAPIPL